ncbi:MAG TPA: universal stress protein [Actinomycetota bacterium]|nr:universal stress protein [Actinomycetota bacterium]
MAYRRILVGTDGSVSAERAERAAIRLADALVAELRVVFASDDLRADATGRAVRAAVDAEVSVSSVVRPGPPQRALVGEAGHWHADLVVVGDRGMGGLRGVALGSVPDSISHDSRSDVLIVRTREDRDRGQGAYRRILIGTDGTPTADRAVWRAADLGRELGSKLVLVFVGHAVTGRNVLEDTASQLEQVEVETRVLEGDPAGAIVGAAEDVGADVVVVGSKGMAGAKRLPTGSVPNRISHRASSDVLIVRTHRGALRDVVPGQGAIVEEGGKELAVYREPSGETIVLSAKCRHLGCTVDWNPVELTWDCPCHGSRYARDGSLMRGPATEGLPRVEPGALRRA